MVTMNDKYVCLADFNREDMRAVFADWTPFYNKSFEDGKLLLAMVDWAQNNIDCRFTVAAGDLYFEDNEDCFKFALTWSEHKGREEIPDEAEEGPETWSAKP